MGVAGGRPECESTRLTEHLETGMIGVALAQWLVEDVFESSSDQHVANRLGNTLGRQAEQLEQLAGRRGLAEAIDPNDGPGAADVLVP